MAKKITMFGIFTALMVVGGYILYFISKIISIPGSKFIFMGLYLTLVMILPLNRYPRFGTLSLINLVFGGVMFILSPWMTLAIIVSGIISDFVMLLPIWKNVKPLLAMGVYNGMSFFTSFYISNYITGNLVYRILNFEVFLVVLVLTVITGILGGYAGLRLDKIYLKLKD
jgi:hypothetical protein